MPSFRRACSLLSALIVASCVGNSTPSDGSSPQIIITAPLDQATVGGQVSIDMNVTDDFGVDKVTVLIDGVVLATMFNPPYHVNWNTQPLVSPSTHQIRVEALDLSQNRSVRQITVQVVNGPTAPPSDPR